jgi:hypothetical protein
VHAHDEFVQFLFADVRKFVEAEFGHMVGYRSLHGSLDEKEADFHVYDAVRFLWRYTNGYY